MPSYKTQDKLIRKPLDESVKWSNIDIFGKPLGFVGVRDLMHADDYTS